MLNEHMQQWSTIQTVRAAGLHHEDIFEAYFGMAGEADEFEVQGYLSGVVVLPASQRDLLAQAINELLDCTGSMADGAHYSSENTAAFSGYIDYLRPLNLSPDGYDFTLPPVGDQSTYATSSRTATSEPAASKADHDLENADLDSSHLDDIEFRRLQALHESGLLQTGAEERFDRIIRQTRDHFGVSTASIALITEDLQVIKSGIGPLSQDLPRELSLCATTIQRDCSLVITDASIHPRWRDHPLVVGEPKIRFYAGHPISTASGWRIGTLCLMDDQPRPFTGNDQQILRRLAAQVQVQLWVQ